MQTYKREYKSGKVAWCYDVWIDGKRKRKCGFAKEREAKAAANDLIAEISKGLDISKDSTFKDFYRQWVEVNKKNKISDSALRNFINALNQFTEYFGEGKKLATLSRMEYQSFLNWYGKDHTKESVRKINNCIKAALDSAQYDGYIVRNPAHNISIKDVAQKPTQKNEIKYVSKSDYIKLKQYFKGKKNLSALLLYILTITGARFSEINNLRYIDIRDDHIYIPEGKTDNAVREISVPVGDIEHIKSVLAQHPRKIQGVIFNLSHNAALKQLRQSLKDCGISKQITIHAIRHSHCSVLLSEGVDIHYISKRLGHANIRITQQVYSHLLEEQEAVEDKQTIQFLESI